MDDNKLSLLKKKQKYYTTISKTASIFLILYIIIILIFVFSFDIPNLLTYGYCGFMLILIFLLVFLILGSNNAKKIVEKTLEELNFEPEETFDIGLKNKFFVNFKTNEWTYSKGYEIDKVYAFNEILDYNVVENFSTISNKQNYCCKLSIVIILRNSSNTLKLNFIETDTSLKSFVYRQSIEMKDKICDILDRIKQINNKNVNNFEYLNQDHEVNVLKTTLEKEKLRADINSIYPKTCAYCGHKNSGSATKCESCGAPL